MKKARRMKIFGTLILLLILLCIIASSVYNRIGNSQIEGHIKGLWTTLRWKALTIGQPVPPIKNVTIDGKSFDLADLKGKYVVLDFWASWCAPCINEFPTMKRYYSKYKRQVEFVGIACKDEDSKWRKSVRETGIDWIQIFNNPADDLPLKYSVKSYPTQILIDPKGNLVKSFQNSKEFYDFLDQLFVHL